LPSIFIADLAIEDQRLLKVALYGLLFGMLIGVERAVRKKPPGVHPGVIIRTLSLIGLGSSLAVGAFPPPEQSAIAAGVLTGIGFIGAGIIYRGAGVGQDLPQGPDEGEVVGVTAAAAIFFLAAVGVSVGIGRTWTAAILTAVAIALLEIEVLLLFLVRKWREWKQRRVVRKQRREDRKQGREDRKQGREDRKQGRVRD
jgi:putative Mg2+ transporter-C (MgtC) family protein